MKLWRELESWLADCWPIIARTRCCGWALGWVERFPQGRTGHLDLYFVRRRHGTITGLMCVRDAWFEACRRRGVLLMTTRIRKNRPGVLALMRRDGWQQYDEDHRFAWFRRTLPRKVTTA